MSDYIEREAALEALCADCCTKECNKELCQDWHNLSVVPAADVRPVVRGKWLNDFCGKGRFSKRIVQCSLCGNFLDLDGVNAGRGDANYCPNCGADMREEKG